MPDNQSHTKLSHSAHHHGDEKAKFDLLLWSSLSVIGVLYALAWLFKDQISSIAWLFGMSIAVFDLINTVWWGIAIGIVMVAGLSKIPREFVIAILGRGGGISGIVRATLGGVLLDLCSHGILMVGAKLYERGASAGQVMAFLIASPWNSFSLTLVLIALIGLKWTLAFIALSMAIAISAGLLFDLLVDRKILPPNPSEIDLPEDFDFWRDARSGLANTRIDFDWLKSMITDGLRESRMVLRWIFFGIVLASLVRAFIETESLQTWFGPTLTGLGLTVLVATIMEVCSEGSAPIAADLLARAGAPGNGFAFLMTGVSTDYTEIMVLRETTGSWKISLFLPLLTLPQVLIVSWLLNLAS
ncbi:MAG: ATPase [Alphaproteobacteria bacterium]|nr:MAG: ATPase [Alphaproteobacteria bacterium]